MNSVQFKKLSPSHQSCFLWEKGVFLCSKKDPLFLIHLYSFQNFYVEVRFSQKVCRVEHINVIDDIKDLEPYLLDLPMPGYLS